MKTVVNKTFNEIVSGDAASIDRTLHAGDVRAWAAAFGEWNVLSAPGESQVAAGIIDGPLDLDAEVDAEAARIKHIASPIAGLADILIVPNIEAGNMIYKNLAFMADPQTAGLVVGARVPVILTSRAGTAAACRLPAAVAVLYADAAARDPTVLHPETEE